MSICLTSCPGTAQSLCPLLFIAHILLTAHFTSAPKAPITGGAGRYIPDKNRATGIRNSSPTSLSQNWAWQGAKELQGFWKHLGLKSWVEGKIIIRLNLFSWNLVNGFSFECPRTPGLAEAWQIHSPPAPLQMLLILCYEE